jgi:mono/diheme cytochrome c family protein
MTRFLLAALALSVPLAIAGPSRAATPAQGAADGWPPLRLRDTGLYDDWESKTVGRDKIRFSPQYPLWTDGALKTRWLRLPQGTWIDASDPDVWTFPVGTRFWKEFAFDRRAETRLIELTRGGWRYATYVWNDDETEAVLAPDRGISRGPIIRGNVRHAIPSRSDCTSCHEAGPSRILGFNALQLSDDRDANAPHAEPVPEGGMTLDALVARGLVRGLPRQAAPPRIAAKSPTERAALGYLYGNCSYCHTSRGELASLKLSFDYPIARPEPEAPAVRTTVEQISTFQPASWRNAERVCVANPDQSVVMARMASRNPVLQMPPVGTRLVDDAAVALIRKWISEDTMAPAHTPWEGKQR